MKIKLLAILSATLLLSPFAAAKSERIHYRCHLILHDKSEIVHGFVSVGETQKAFEKGLPGRTVYSADGVTGVQIEKIYQCVQAGKRFATARARQLEAETPF